MHPHCRARGEALGPDDEAAEFEDDELEMAELIAGEFAEEDEDDDDPDFVPDQTRADEDKLVCCGCLCMPAASCSGHFLVVVCNGLKAFLCDAVAVHPRAPMFNGLLRQ
jgi:hypothetical protein